jgi:hypothetical protein
MIGGDQGRKLDWWSVPRFGNNDETAPKFGDANCFIGPSRRNNSALYAHHFPYRGRKTSYPSPHWGKGFRCAIGARVLASGYRVEPPQQARAANYDIPVYELKHDKVEFPCGRVISGTRYWPYALGTILQISSLLPTSSQCDVKVPRQ